MIKSVNTISCQDIDRLVRDTYGAIYCFQQQDDCRDRGTYRINVPVARPYDFHNDDIPVQVNGPVEGVSFKAWKEKIGFKFFHDYGDGLFWERNFYPHIDMIMNDLHSRGLIPAGELLIIIDW